MAKKKRHRVGRNDLCPCGSGRKYKHCCLRKQAPSTLLVLSSYATRVFMDYGDRLSSSFPDLMNRDAEECVADVLARQDPPAEWQFPANVAVLKALGNKLETRIAEIVAKHHPYYWLHLYRMVAPEQILAGQSDVTVALYREIMEAAFLKYGNDTVGDDLILGDRVDPEAIMSGEYARVMRERGLALAELPGGAGNVFLRKFSQSDFVQLHSLERLAAEYWRVTANLRRAYKGGILLVPDRKTYWVDHDEETEELIQSYDERNERFGTLTTTTGIPFSASLGSSDICFLPRYNVSRFSLRELPVHMIWQLRLETLELLKPNFVWMPVDLGSYYVQHEFLAKPFATYHGLALDCFVRCILAIGRHAVLEGCRDVSRTYQLLQRAYAVWNSTDALTDRILQLTNELDIPRSMPQRKLEREEVAAFLSAFKWTNEARSRVDLTTRGPRSLLVETWPNHCVLDYAALASILLTATHYLQAESGAKGTLFEAYAIEELAGARFHLWKHQSEIEALDGTKKEIDLSFIMGSMLFICELRCVARSWSYEKGEPEALAFRRSKMEGALSDCQEKAEMLAAQPHGRNYSVPEQVTSVVPLVVSPFVEFVWSSSEDLWLTDDIPRICTTGELKKLDAACLDVISRKPFVKTLNR